jgi:hypothetical protein
LAAWVACRSVRVFCVALIGPSATVRNTISSTHRPDA